MRAFAREIWITQRVQCSTSSTYLYELGIRDFGAWMTEIRMTRQEEGSNTIFVFLKNKPFILYSKRWKGHVVLDLLLLVMSWFYIGSWWLVWGDENRGWGYEKTDKQKNAHTGLILSNTRSFLFIKFKWNLYSLLFFFNSRHSLIPCPLSLPTLLVSRWWWRWSFISIHIPQPRNAQKNRKWKSEPLASWDQNRERKK